MASEWAKDNVAILYLVHEGWRVYAGAGWSAWWAERSPSLLHRSPEPAPPFPLSFPRADPIQLQRA